MTIQMIGKTFNRLTVIEQHPTNKDRHRAYVCKCVCGRITIVSGKFLRNGNTKSCGCYGREVRMKSVTKHGYAFTPTYKIWAGMKARCLNPNEIAFKHYGAKGITVCERWLHFENFLADMGERPDGKTLDRIDNDKGYFPSNCRWVSFIEQQNNKKRFLLTLNGETKLISEWAKERNLKRKTIHMRLQKGWSAEKALSPMFKPNSITIDGEEKSLAQWCRERAMNYLTVLTRIKRGMDPVVALNTPVGDL